MFFKTSACQNEVRSIIAVLTWSLVKYAPYSHQSLYFLQSYFNLVTFYRPFLHSCKQRHQVEARVDKTQWFEWNSPPEPRPHFLMFAHWSGMRERSIRCNIIYYSQLTQNKENKTCLTMNLTLTKVHKTKKPNKLCYTGDNPDIYFLHSESVSHFFLQFKRVHWQEYI